MRKWCVLGIALALAAVASTSQAAPNVTNVTQKGSVLVWPDIRVDDNWNTIIRIQNDNSSDIDVLCYWMDGNKNRVDFVIKVTSGQPFWFDARTGRGTRQVNLFPISHSNGIDNPFLVGPGATEATDSAGPYRRGLLACWAVSPAATQQVKWNHLSGTATLYDPNLGTYEYNAYAVFAIVGADKGAVGAPGQIDLNGALYDQCSEYLIGQFTPNEGQRPAAPRVSANRLVVASCILNFKQDWFPTWTGLTFEVWTEDGNKFTGAYECADSWHETDFLTNFDSAVQNFALFTLNTYAARYRVQGQSVSNCDDPAAKPPRVTQAVPLFAVSSAQIGGDYVGTTLFGAGKVPGRILWDPEGATPEGGIR